MRRRILFTSLFILLGAAVFWYTNFELGVPRYSFDEAAKIGDSHVKVIVTGTLVEGQIGADAKGLTFYMKDSTGTPSKVFYDGQEKISTAQLESARSAGRSLSVSGHSCGDRFHSSGITIH